MKKKMRVIASNNVFIIITLLLLLLKSSIILGFVNQNDNNIKFYNLITGARYISSIEFLVLPIIFFLSFSYLFKSRGRTIYLIVLNAVISIIFLADIWYFRGFKSATSLRLLKQTTNLDGLSGSIFDLIYAKDFIIIMDIIIIILIMIAYKIVKKKKLVFECKRNIISFILIVAISIIYIPIKIHVFNNPILMYYFRYQWKPERNLNYLSPIGYHMFDAYEVLTKSSYKMSEEDKKEIKLWFKNNNEQLPDNKYKGMFKGKNLIILQVESLENFVVNQKVGNQEIIPNINKLLKNSIYCSNYYEEVGQGTSSDCDFMTNTSMYPLTSGSVCFSNPKNTYPVTMPKIMEKYGYDTVAIHPDKAAYWNWKESLTNLGFNKCIDVSQFKMYEKIGLGISDGCYLSQVEQILKKQKQPFYSFMVTLTSHTPFNLPDKYRKLKLESSVDKTHMGGYIQSVHYTDEQIGKFINNLSKDGILKNSVLVIYGDHTGVHKYHNSEVKGMKDFSLAKIDNKKRIPLIIYSEGLKPEEIKINSGQVDLMPTLCYLMGINKDDIKDYVMGKNILNTKRDYATYINGKVMGNYSGKDKKHIVDGIINSQKIIKSNYYKKHK